MSLKTASFLLCISILVTVVSGFERVDAPRAHDKVCLGTDNGFSYPGPQVHYDRFRSRYRDCTYVSGNLEITHMSRYIASDLSFLSTIEVVTGYVLIGLVTVDTIPLHSLRVIGGDNTFEIMGGNRALAVVMCDGLQELQMPSLQEISKGTVIFYRNPLLKFVNTINWDTIVLEKNNPAVIATGGVSES
ncbi:hypothetical protein ScPMuIL_011697, partial [Solemya velum]